MKSKTTSCAVALGLLVLCGCSNDEYGYADSPGVVAEVYATVSQALTRASGTSWATGDAIGVSLGSFSNYKYVVSDTSTGAFSAAEDDIYITSQSTSTATAYYPFSGTAGEDAETLDVSTATEYQTETNQPSIDYLFGSDETVSQSNSSISLTMAHKMSMVTFSLAGYSDGTEVEASDITALAFSLGNIAADGTFDTSDGTANSDEDYTDEVSTETLSAATSASLILLPQTAEGVLLTVNLNGTYYQATLTSVELTAGYKTTYNITIDNSSTSPTLTISGITITDWVESESVEVTVEIDVPEVDSSVVPTSWTEGEEKTTTATSSSSSEE